MTIARRGLWIAVVVVLLVEAELHLRDVMTAVLATGLIAVAWAGSRPLGCLLGICALLLGDSIAGGMMLSGLIAPLFVVAGVAFVAGGRVAPKWLTPATMASAALLTAANQIADPGAFSTANDAIFFAALVGVPASAGSLLATRSRQVLEQRRLIDEVGRLQDLAVRAARAAEAERVERAVDHALAGRLVTITGGIRHALAIAETEPPAVPAALATVETTSRQALSELRAVLGVLQPSAPGPAVAHASRDSISHIDPVREIPRKAAAPGLIDLSLVLLVVPLLVETSPPPSSPGYWPNVIACLSLGALLAVVRRAPITGTLLFAVVACTQTALLAPLPATVSWVLPGLALAFLLGLHMPRQRRWWGLALCLGVALAVLFCTPADARDTDGLVPMLVAPILIWWAGLTVAARQWRAAALAARAFELSRTADEDVLLAAAEQRAEMARDLHDVGAHTLTVVCLQSVAAQTLWDRDREQASVALGILDELAGGPLQHLSNSLGRLTAVDMTAPLDVSVLEVLTGIGRVLGLDVAADVRGTPFPLPSEVARAAFRVVQESLTNVARHAPGATVAVTLVYRPNGLEIRVGDSGPAATSPGAAIPIHGAGAGLRGMRERVEACRGELDFGADENGGFHVLARLPTGMAS